MPYLDNLVWSNLACVEQQLLPFGRSKELKDRTSSSPVGIPAFSIFKFARAGHNNIIIMHTRAHACAHAQRIYYSTNN